MYLVDTNVISEARKGAKANAGVRQFFKTTGTSDLYLSAQSVGEIRRGLESIWYRGDQPQARKLENWLALVTYDYVDRLLSFDEGCTQVWGRLMSPNHQHPINKQIAALVLIHDLTVVTRSVDEFQGTGAGLLNPFVP